MTTPFAASQDVSKAAGEEFEVLLVSGDDEQPGYSVFCPALPGCISQGDDWDHALEMITEAIGGFLELGPRPVVETDSEKSRMICEWTALGCQVETATVKVVI